MLIFRFFMVWYISIIVIGSVRVYNIMDIVFMVVILSNYVEKNLNFVFIYLIFKMLENIFYLLNENNIKRFFNCVIFFFLYYDIVKCKFCEMIKF